MSTKSERPRHLLRYPGITSICMIVVGLLGFLTMVLYTVPSHAKVTSALTSHGAHTQGTVTRCEQATTDEHGDRGLTNCRVRSTPSGGHSVESPLAFGSHLQGGEAVEVAYDPGNVGIVALPSDLGYWPTLYRNFGDMLLLFIAAAMVPMGIAGLFLRRLLASFMKRYTDEFGEVDPAVTQFLTPDVAQAMAQAWTQQKPPAK
ncbi:hypothetical protein QMK19_15935 [Streptomyces sp. H10-C2]|uniref:DUF3592 domain-containing protein n=1 Tax=unclassified Streptomyces TaxID=2593676 RepID=UPI0024BB0C28|nr:MULTISPECIES: DUF3592 domain-containing protein [unclassified Streptomyces]MDJ0346185.1 hypothetical protein [Streptomyces sp. PH10-H1]MDJ0371136.1 hypothetical protein [Streptomyces sp. H10-C2]